MNELIRMVMEKTGLDQGKATQAAESVLGFLKEKVPGIGGQLDSFLGTGSGESHGAGEELKKKAGSLFGRE